MDEKWKQLLGSFLMGVLMPAMMIRQPVTTVETPQVTTQGTTPVIQVTQHPTTIAPEREQWIPVLMDGKRLVMMELETYIVGVVLGEMPADFEMEALTAQAVVARTYALRCYRYTTKHLGGSICTDSP